MVYQISSFRGGISDYDDKGLAGAFKFGYGLDIRKVKDSLSCQQALIEEGLTNLTPSASQSPSGSASPSGSQSPSISASSSPSFSRSSSASQSPSGSQSPSRSASPSSSVSGSPSPSAGLTTVFNDLIRSFVRIKQRCQLICDIYQFD